MMRQPELFGQSLNLPGFPCAWSPDRVHRYTLWRTWYRTLIGNPQWRYAAVIGLNPSTADETRDDPTIRRCIDFAKSWDVDALCMLNLFAFRATDPRDMKAAADPVGAENDAWLIRICRGASLVLAAWGVHGEYQGRDRAVRQLLEEAGVVPLALGFTKAGHPRHPLYMPKSAEPRPFVLEVAR